MATQGHNRLVMTDGLKAEISKYVGSERRHAGVRGKLIARLRTMGIRWTDMISPKSEGSTATDEWWEELRSAIVAGFTAEQQRLIAADPRKATAKMRPDAVERWKEKRKVAQQQIGARISDLKKGLKPVDPKGANNRTRPVGQRLADDCAHMEKTLSALEGDYTDLIKAIRALKARVAKIKAD